jgi:hypothetical protein
VKRERHLTLAEMMRERDCLLRFSDPATMRLRYAGRSVTWIRSRVKRELKLLERRRVI